MFLKTQWGDKAVSSTTFFIKHWIHFTKGICLKKSWNLVFIKVKASLFQFHFWRRLSKHFGETKDCFFLLKQLSMKIPIPVIMYLTRLHFRLNFNFNLSRCDIYQKGTRAYFLLIIVRWKNVIGCLCIPNLTTKIFFGKKNYRSVLKKI